MPEGRAAAPAGGTGAREACVGAPGAAVCESTRLSCRIDWLLSVAGKTLVFGPLDEHGSPFLHPLTNPDFLKEGKTRGHKAVVNSSWRAGRCQHSTVDAGLTWWMAASQCFWQRLVFWEKVVVNWRINRRATAPTLRTVLEAHTTRK